MSPEIRFIHQKTLQGRSQPLRESVSPLAHNKRNPPLLEVGVDTLRFFFFYSPLERVEMSIPSTTSCSVFISSSAKLK